MNKLVCKENFILNNKSYIKGDKLDITDMNTIRKLNERGLIEPLRYEDMIMIEREINMEKEEN